ncbi:hypothetical protein D3C78_1983750 [compost metagenome]
MPATALRSFLKVSVSSSRAISETTAEPTMYQATEEPLPVIDSSAVVTNGVAALPKRPESM